MVAMRLPRSLVAVALVALVAAACGRSSAGPGGEPGSGPDATLMPSSPTELPDFDYAAYTQLLDELHGAPLVVNVWASWCGPCRDEAPALAGAATTYGDRVRFLGIDVLDARPDAVAFIEEFGWSYPSVFDRDAEIRDRLGLLGQPVTLFYDASGALVDTHVGAISADLLDERIGAMLEVSSA
jgi:thiol-disulfide isomerase/thioredoxin